MSSSDNAPGKRRSRKSIAVMPTNAAATTSSNSSAPGEGSKEREREREKETETLALKPKKKSRSKSLGPGGLLDASGGAEAGSSGNGLKSGSGNGRRESVGFSSFFLFFFPLSFGAEGGRDCLSLGSFYARAQLCLHLLLLAGALTVDS